MKHRRRTTMTAIKFDVYKENFYLLLICRHKCIGVLILININGFSAISDFPVSIVYQMESFIGV